MPQTPVNPNYGGSGVLRLQAVLAKANLARQDNPASPSPSDNSRNIYISRDLLGYTTPMDSEEQLKLVGKYADKNMEKDFLMSGVSSLSNAFGKTGGFSTVFGSYTPR